MCPDPLFYGVIGMAFVVIASVGILIALKIKKKRNPAPPPPPAVSPDQKP